MGNNNRNGRKRRRWLWIGGIILVLVLGGAV